MTSRFRSVSLKLALTGLGLMGLSVSWAAKAPVESVQAQDKIESSDRVVDRAAVEIQREVIKRIRGLMKSPSGQALMPDLYYQLGSAQMDAAALYFRIAHERSHRKGAKLDLKEHHQFLNDAIASLTTFLKMFPNHERLPEVLFLRGSSYDDIEKKDLAEKDFLRLTKSFPEVPETSPAYMKLAEYATDRKDHRAAIGFLEALEKRPNDNYYPFALYKLGWAHYNLSEILISMDYLKRHIAYYDEVLAQDTPALESPDKAIRDNSLRDLAMFYFEGFQKGQNSFALDRALKDFASYVGKSPVEPVATRFTALLRTRNNDDELEQWSGLLMASKLQRRAVLDALGIVFENQNNRRLYPPMLATTARIQSIVIRDASLKVGKEADSIRDHLDEATKFLHKTIQANKKHPETKNLLSTLSSLYDTIIALSDPRDPRIPGAHYNLAETYYDMKNYEKATTHYRLVLTELKSIAKGLDLKDVSLRALSARFELLRERSIIPEKLEPKSLAKDNPKAKLDPLFLEWKDWIAAHESSFGRKEAVFEKFRYESIRVLYSRGLISDALSALKDHILSLKEISADQSVAVNLYLDTLILSEHWEDLYEISQSFAKKKFAQADLKAKVADIESDSWIKMAEADYAKKDLKEALYKAEKCVSRYAQLDKKWICEFLAARVLQEREGFEKALKSLNRLVEQDTNKELRLSALRLRAQGYVESFEFEKALRDELKLAQIKEENTPKRRELIFSTLLLTNSPSLYKSLLQNESFCLEEKARCQLLGALLEIKGVQPFAGLDVSAIGGREKSLRPVFALASLDDNRKSFIDSMKILDLVGEFWEKQDALMKFQLAGELGGLLKKTFGEMRARLKTSFAIGEDPFTVKRRINNLKVFEKTATKVSDELGWSHIRELVTLEVAQAYNDFADEISEAEFKKPLTDKAQKLRDSLVSMQKIKETGKDVVFDEMHFAKIFADKKPLEAQFFKALRDHNLQAGAYFLSFLNKDPSVTGNRKLYLEASLMDAVGARVEALEQVEELKAKAEAVIVSKGGSR